MSNTSENTRWVIRIFDVNVKTSFRHPIEIIDRDEELRSFLNSSELAIDDYEKSRFLSVGDTFQINEEEYKVNKIHLKFYDHQQMKLTGSEIHVLLGVEKQ